jgi:ATP-dependent DNA ligase
MKDSKIPEDVNFGGENMEFFQYSGDIMYAPSPGKELSSSDILDYEKKGYVGQIKFKGLRSLVEICPNGEIKLWDAFRNRLYLDLTDGLKSDLLELHGSLKSSTHLVLDGELFLDGGKYKDRFIANDVLVCEDNYLVDMPTLERYNLLDAIMGEQEALEIETGLNCSIYVRDHLWQARTFIYGLSNEFSRLSKSNQIEGMTLKRLDSVLQEGNEKNNNASWNAFVKV